MVNSTLTTYYDNGWYISITMNKIQQLYRQMSHPIIVIFVTSLEISPIYILFKTFLIATNFWPPLQVMHFFDIFCWLTF
jgi:hypothetical protein